MNKRIWLFMFLTILLFPLINAEQYNKISLEPFYLSSMAKNTNYNFNLGLFPSDKISSVLSAMIFFQVYPTADGQVFTLDVNGGSCKNPTYIANLGPALVGFDCSNRINQSGNYTLILSSNKNSNSLISWIDFTYINNPTNDTEIAKEVWNYNNRNLTHSEDTTNYSKINEGVWGYNDRNLTFFPIPPQPNNLTAQEVWEYVNRDLTYYEVNNITPEDIWIYLNRTLTGFGFNVVNETSIAESVWSYEGEVSENILSQFMNKIWNFTGIVSSSIGNFFSDKIWTRINRNLTYYPEPNNLTAEEIWGYSNRTLTSFGFNIAESVWGYNERNLTYYETITINNSAIAQEIWNYINRTLTNSLNGLTAEQNQTLYNIFILLGSVNETVSNIQTTQSSIAGALQIVHSTVSQYSKGENGSSVVLVKLNEVPTSGVTVTGDYYYPNQTVWISSASFSEIGTTGVYYYNFQIPENNPDGVYKVRIKGEKSTTGSSDSDNFDDGNDDGWENTGGNWSIVDEGSPQGYVYKTNAKGGRFFAYSNDIGNQLDFTYEAKVRRDVSYSYVGLGFRYIDSGNNYIFQIGTSTLRLIKFVNGVSMTLKQVPFTSTIGVWYNVSVIISGGDIKFYVNDDLKIDYIDSNPLSTGKIALYMQNYNTVVSVGSWDDINLTAYGTSDSAYSIIDFKINEPTSAEVNNTAIVEGVWNYTGRYTHGVEG